MSVAGARERIESEVLAWASIEAHRHRFGGCEYRIGKREIGHIHGDALVDIPFPVKVRDDVIAAGRAEQHHILPKSGWVSFYLRKPEDIAEAIALLRLSYEIAVKQKGLVARAWFLLLGRAGWPNWDSNPRLCSRGV
jgi:hypothetical protein